MLLNPLLPLSILSTPTIKMTRPLNARIVLEEAIGSHSVNNLETYFVLVSVERTPLYQNALGVRKTEI